MDRDLNVEFESFEEALGCLGAGVEAPECHGVLVGWLLSSHWNPQGFPAELTAERWVLSVLDDSPATLDEARGSERREWALGVLEEAWGRTVNALGDPAFSFAPVLPDDERPIGQRARAVGSWCAGFLSGLGQGGRLGEIELSADVQEIIGDFGEITRIEPSPEDGEASERALSELVEYVRAGVMLIGDELQQLTRAEPARPGRVH